MWEQAFTILDHENGKENPWATLHNINGTVDRGCLQVNSIHADKVNGDLASLYSPSVNARVAYQIYSEWRGWCAWSTARTVGYCK